MFRKLMQKGLSVQRIAITRRMDTKAANSQIEEQQKRVVVEQLTDRQLVRVQGEEVVPFLQGLITNDMQNLEDRPAGFASIYAMFLNKAGRVQFDTIVYRTTQKGKFLIECDKSVSDELLRHLRIYRVRRRIEIENADGEMRLWTIFNPDVKLQAKMDVMQNFKQSTDEYFTLPDPRLHNLGLRILSRPEASWSDMAEQLHKINSGFSVLTPTAEINYRVHRYRFGVGEGVQDLPPGKCFPLEANCDFLHGVSFHKGCYIGQELTARVHHTGVVRKRLMPLTLRTATPAKDVAVRSQTGTNVGTLRGIAHNRALALMRIEPALNAEKLLVDGQECSIEKPDWWATESPKRATMCEGR